MHAQVIDITCLEDLTEEKALNLFVRIYRSMNRWFKRQLRRCKNVIARIWYKIPYQWQRILVISAGFMGWILAWAVFYASILISAAYGLAPLLGVVACWCLLAGWIITRMELDPKYGVA